MNEVKNANYEYFFLTTTSVALFIFIVYFLAKFGACTKLSKIYRILIGFFSVLFLVSLLIFQISLIGAVVGGGATAGYIIIATLFLEVLFGLALLVRAARRINLKSNSTGEKLFLPSSKYSSLEIGAPLIFFVLSVCFIILIFSFRLFILG